MMFGFSSKIILKYNDDLILERTGKTRKELFLQIIQKLEKFGKSYKILDGLGEVLKDEKHKNFVKIKLVPELIGVLKFKVDFE